MSQGWRHFGFAKIESFDDGDTAVVSVDLGFAPSKRIRHAATVPIRLFGISCPETKGGEKEWGQIALQRANAFFLAQPCQLWSLKMSFDRYVGRLLVGTHDVARYLIEKGFGAAWDGKAERPVFQTFPIEDTLSELGAYDLLLAKEFKP